MSGIYSREPVAAYTAQESDGKRFATARARLALIGFSCYRVVDGTYRIAVGGWMADLPRIEDVEAFAREAGA